MNRSIVTRSRRSSLFLASAFIACALLTGLSPEAYAQPRVKNQKKSVKTVPRPLATPVQILKPNENATVRGMIQFRGTGAPYAAPHVKVTLAPVGSGPRPAAAYSGTDGMYYFSVPAGTYLLQIWQRDKPARTFKIPVNQKFVNLAVILL